MFGEDVSCWVFVDSWCSFRWRQALELLAESLGALGASEAHGSILQWPDWGRDEEEFNHSWCSSPFLDTECGIQASLWLDVPGITFLLNAMATWVNWFSFFRGERSKREALVRCLLSSSAQSSDFLGATLKRCKSNLHRREARCESLASSSSSRLWT